MRQRAPPPRTTPRHCLHAHAHYYRAPHAPRRCAPPPTHARTTAHKRCTPRAHAACKTNSHLLLYRHRWWMHTTPAFQFLGGGNIYNACRLFRAGTTTSTTEGYKYQQTTAVFRLQPPRCRFAPRRLLYRLRPFRWATALPVVHTILNTPYPTLDATTGTAIKRTRKLPDAATQTFMPERRLVRVAKTVCSVPLRAFWFTRMATRQRLSIAAPRTQLARRQRTVCSNIGDHAAQRRRMATIFRTPLPDVWDHCLTRISHTSLTDGIPEQDARTGATLPGASSG